MRIGTRYRWTPCDFKYKPAPAVVVIKGPGKIICHTLTASAVILGGTSSRVPKLEPSTLNAKL